MNIKSHSELRDKVHCYFDNYSIYHRFEDLYSFDGESSVMLFMVYLPEKRKEYILKAFPHFDLLTSVNVLESKVPYQYYIEFIYPNLPNL